MKKEKKKIVIKHKMVRPRWTDGEISILKDKYQENSNKDLAKLLKRKETSIIFKAFRLNLSKNANRLSEMGKQNISKRWKTHTKSVKKVKK